MNANQTNNKEFYTKIWLKDWYDMERYNPTARHLERIIVRLISSIDIKSILDVGCGMGVNIKRIRRHYKDVKIVGADLSKAILKMAENYVGKDRNISYHTLDLGKEKLDRKFDLVLCSQVLEHIKDDSTAMKHIVDMCSKYILITVPGGKYDKTSRLIGHHCRHYSKQRLLGLIRKHNLKILYLGEWGFPFHSIYKTILNLLPDNQKKKIGLGKYGIIKKGLSDVLYFLFYGNIFNKGDNLILLAEKT